MKSIVHGTADCQLQQQRDTVDCILRLPAVSCLPPAARARVHIRSRGNRFFFTVITSFHSSTSSARCWRVWRLPTVTESLSAFVTTLYNDATFLTQCFRLKVSKQSSAYFCNQSLTWLFHQSITCLRLVYRHWHGRSVHTSLTCRTMRQLGLCRPLGVHCTCMRQISARRQRISSCSGWLKVTHIMACCHAVRCRR